MLPASTVVRQSWDHKQAPVVLFQQECSPSEVNAVIAQQIAKLSGDAQDVVITTPGWGVRVYAVTHFGVFHAMGVNYEAAMASIALQFNAREITRQS